MFYPKKTKKEFFTGVLGVSIILSLLIIPFVYGAINSYENLVAIENEFGESTVILGGEQGRILVVLFDNGGAEESYWFAINNERQIVDKEKLTDIQLEHLMNEIKSGNVDAWRYL